MQVCNKPLPVHIDLVFVTDRLPTVVTFVEEMTGMLLSAGA